MVLLHLLSWEDDSNHYGRYVDQLLFLPAFDLDRNVYDTCSGEKMWILTRCFGLKHVLMQGIEIVGKSFERFSFGATHDRII